MRREPDNQSVIDDDSGSYDVRDLRGQRIDPELVDLIVRAIQKIRPSVRYQESNNGLLKWLLGLVSTLAGAAIIGGVEVYGTLQGVRAIQEQQQRQLDRIENRLDGRSGITRGGADDPHAR